MCCVGNGLELWRGGDLGPGEGVEEGGGDVESETRVG